MRQGANRFFFLARLFCYRKARLETVNFEIAVKNEREKLTVLSKMRLELECMQ